MLIRNEDDAKAWVSTFLVNFDLSEWFVDINLDRLAAIQQYPLAWMPLYLHAKQNRVEQELVAAVNARVALSQVAPLVHWLDLPDPEPDAWIVEGLIRKGALSILAGCPKVGKSTVITHMLASIMRGGNFIDRACFPTTALYYALEEIGSEVKARLKNYGLGDEPLYIREGHVPPEHFIDMLRGDIASVEAGFVLIDPLFDILQVASANDYQPLNRALKELLKVCRDTGAHIMCLHHTAKGTNNLLGSQSLRGCTDCNLYLELTNANERLLYSENRYGVALDKFFVKMQDDQTLKFIHSLLE